MEFTLSPAPYPGLRTFRQSESDIFFGRDEHVSALLAKLEKSHFLCITGTSGSGKSSLARTGLFNALQAGFLPGRGSDWVICDVSPQRAPLQRLTRGLAAAVVMDPQEPNQPTPQQQARIAALAAMFETYIDEESSDLNAAIEVLDEVGDRPVIILIDQFEELHRYAQIDRHAAARFVDVLLQTAAAAKQIYVVITVRHEELARCARFPGLNAAINDSQFLTPALDRFQLQEAIEGPIRLHGGEIDPHLTVRILNDLEKEMDKLPLMQHALKLLFERRKGSEPLVIGVEDFNEAFELDAKTGLNGTATHSALRRAMSNRLDRIYQRLPKRLREVTPRAFSALTNIASLDRDIRNPVPLSELARIVDRPVAEVIELVEAFSGSNAGYLVSKGPLEAGSDPEIDVTHECVLRLWRKLQEEWLPAEAKNAQQFKDIARRAGGWTQAGTWARNWWSRLRDDRLPRGSELDQFDGWWTEVRPNAHWADRYLREVNAEGKTGLAKAVQDDEPGVSFDGADKFLRAAKSAERDRGRIWRGVSIATPLLALAIAGWFVVDDARDKEIAAKQQEREQALRVVAALNPGLSDPQPVQTIRLAVRAFETVDKLAERPVERWEAITKLWWADFFAFERERYQHPGGGGGNVLAAAFVGDGSQIATLTQSPRLRIWERGEIDVEKSREIELAEETNGLELPEGEESRAMRVAPGGNLLAFSTQRGGIWVVDLTTEKALMLVSGRSGRRRAVRDLSFSADGLYLAAASQSGQVRMFRRGTDGPLDWRPLEAIDFSDRVWSVGLNNDGTRLVAGLGQGKVCLAEPLREGQPAVCSGDGHHKGYAVKAVAFRPGSDIFVSAGNDDRAVVWKVEKLRNGSGGIHPLATGQNLWHESDIWDLAYDPEGKLMATIAWDGSIRLFDAVHWKPLGLMRGHFQSPRTVVFDPTGRYLLSASLDNTARVWSPFASLAVDEHYSQWFAAATGSGAARSIVDMTFGPDAEWLALTDGDEVIAKAPNAPPKTLPTRQGSGAEAKYSRLAIGRSGTGPAILVSTLQSQELRFWLHGAGDAEWPEGRMAFDFGSGTASEQSLFRRAVAISPDGERVAVSLRSGGAYSVAICPVPQSAGRVICSEGDRDVVHIAMPKLSAAGMNSGCKRQEPTPNALVWSHDGARLAVGGQDCVVRVFDVANSTAAPRLLIDHVGSITALDIDAEGTILTGSSDHTARVWPADGSASIPLWKQHVSAITGARLAPDGETAVTVSGDEKLLIWNTRNGELRSRLPGHSSTITALDLAPDAAGRTLIATGTTGGDLKVIPYFDQPADLLAFSRRNLVPILGPEATETQSDQGTVLAQGEVGDGG